MEKRKEKKKAEQTVRIESELTSCYDAHISPYPKLQINMNSTKCRELKEKRRKRSAQELSLLTLV